MCYNTNRGVKMKISVRGKKLEVTKAIHDYAIAKIGRLDKYFEDPNNITAHIIVRVSGIDQIVEVTIPTKNIILRAEERNKDLYAAIDLVTEKLERQIRKNKTKMHRKKVKAKFEDLKIEFDVDEQEENNSKIVKRKTIDTKPMNEEEAILQMELLGHDFFVYQDDEQKNICVLYRRKDGNYGVIETN